MDKNKKMFSETYYNSAYIFPMSEKYTSKFTGQITSQKHIDNKNLIEVMSDYFGDILINTTGDRLPYRFYYTGTNAHRIDTGDLIFFRFDNHFFATAIVLNNLKNGDEGYEKQEDEDDKDGYGGCLVLAPQSVKIYEPIVRMEMNEIIEKDHKQGLFPLEESHVEEMLEKLQPRIKKIF